MNCHHFSVVVVLDIIVELKVIIHSFFLTFILLLVLTGNQLTCWHLILILVTFPRKI